MLTVTHMAVIVDLEQEAHHALKRAVEISKLFDANITLLTWCHDKNPDASMAQLIELAKDIEVDGELHYKVTTGKPVHQGLLDYINKSDIDLVLKTAHQHTALEKFLTPTDWHLLRETDVPILFVKNGNWPSKSNVMGAINIDSDSAHQALNDEIIDNTIKLAEMCGGNPHLINVFPWPLFDFAQLKHLVKREDHYKKMSASHQKSLMKYINGRPIKKEWVHHAEGLTPEECIPDIIRSNKSDLLVIGTIKRNGLQAMTTGNTTEKILDDIQCEVLALK